MVSKLERPVGPSKKKAPSIALVLLFALVLLVGTSINTWPAIKAVQSGAAPPGAGTWLGIIAVNLAITAACGLLLFLATNQMLISFTEEEIKGPFGRVLMNWREVTHVETTITAGQILAVNLIGSNKKVHVNALYYVDGNELLKVVKSHVPTSAAYRNVN